jgi:uncharacterized protein (TIGR02757 family)
MGARLAVKRRILDEIHAAYHRIEYIHPDPLEFLHGYARARDREVVGLVASSLAYGRVGQILRSVSQVLGPLGPSPAEFLEHASGETLREAFAGFRHRFTDGGELADLLQATGRIIREYGSVQECFLRGYRSEDTDITDALIAFARELKSRMSAQENSLLPCPERGSACKRLHLYLRWMVRRDAVDPGCWEGVSKSLLIVPLDVHMHRICTGLGLTSRSQADLRTAREITASFRKIAPDDPVRYDFALTRVGIRMDIDPTCRMRYNDLLRC